MKNLYCVLSFSFFLSISYAQNDILWSDPVDIADAQYGNIYPRIVINDSETPFISWGASNQKIYFSKANSNGFTTPIELNTSDKPAYVANWTGPEIAVKGDTIYACFMHANWNEKSFLVRSFDGGENFSGPLELENYSDSTSRFPMVAIDQEGNPITSFMKMSSNGGHDPHYVVRRSQDFGMSYYDEQNLGGWSGTASEACDCCPASMKVDGSTVAIFYRDNLNNLRDIWASVSTDGSESFNQGFAIDNNKWMINSCPASGPDGVIIEDDLFSVFYSDGYAFLSKTNISTEDIEYVNQLGELPTVGSHNFPRIDHDGNTVAIVWKANAGVPYLLFSFKEDINSAEPFTQDTLHNTSFNNPDIVVKNNKVHIVWQDSNSGTVKYLLGTVGTTRVEDQELISATLFPNPSQESIFIKTNQEVERFEIYNNKGDLMKYGKFNFEIDINEFSSGIYFVKLFKGKEIVSTRSFVKS